MLAAWLFAVVNNGLILLGVNSYWQYLATGVILVLALVLGLIGAGGRVRRPRGGMPHGIQGAPPNERGQSAPRP